MAHTFSKDSIILYKIFMTHTFSKDNIILYKIFMSEVAY